VDIRKFFILYGNMMTTRRLLIDDKLLRKVKCVASHTVKPVLSGHPWDPHLGHLCPLDTGLIVVP